MIINTLEPNDCISAGNLLSSPAPNRMRGNLEIENGVSEFGVFVSIKSTHQCQSMLRWVVHYLILFKIKSAACSTSHAFV
ncbi:hypothetical protein QWZ13_17640 [Reinekea marina]|uniref:hypothetical protein n=1 Tax=Reinekea marina TaxID=1310421 RepID=UPI0025B553D7|nr:hypothetical protein [Reinekea marina]MDN3650733.1 hypothetical protein [Reinekea marina]